MAYRVSSVDVFVVDLHVTARRLLRPKLLRKEFAFLANAAAYRKRHNSPARWKSSSFSIRTIPWRERRWNHFWVAFRGIWHGKAADDWKLQLPFECRPLTAKFELVAKPKAYQVSIRPISYLNALGWSHNLEFNLAGEI